MSARCPRRPISTNLRDTAWRDVSKIKMSAEARTLFSMLRRRVLEVDTEVIELAEANSVSYHGPSFFLEVLPRRYRLTLLVALDYSEIDDPPDFAQDATQWKFFVHAKYEGGVSLSVSDEMAIEKRSPISRVFSSLPRALESW